MLTRGIFMPRQFGKFLIKQIEEKYFNQVVDINAKAFANNDPMSQAIGIEEDHMKQLIYKMKSSILNPPTSIIAIDTSTDIVAGAVVTEDY